MAQMRQLYIDNQQSGNNISKISFYSTSSGYVAFTNWVGYTTDSGRSFTQRFIMPGNVNYNGVNVNLIFGFGISGVKAFSADTLVVYGDYGAVPSILYSTDSGKTYALVYYSQANSQRVTQGVTDMTFSQDGNTGYAVEADRIIKTVNRGASWGIVLNDANGFYDKIQAIDANNVIAASESKALKTSNGGANWQTIPIPGNSLAGIYFLTPSKAWLNLANTYGVYYSSDGGANWVQKNQTLVNPFRFSAFHFINDSVGYSVEGFDVLRTIDSGRVWQVLPRDNSYSYLNFGFNDLFFYSSTQFWAGGGQGFLEMTSNGGGIAEPQANFTIDTAGVWGSNLVKLINYSQKGYQYGWYVNGSLVSTDYHTLYTHDFRRQTDTIQLVVSNGSSRDTLQQVQSFNVPVLPVISGFSPVVGSKGTVVVISGVGFSEVSSISFGGTVADSFTINSSRQITAYVGSGSTGNVSVSDYRATGSLSGFTYYPPSSTPAPAIFSFSPVSGPVGSTVVLSGYHFDLAPANNIVYFGATRAVVSSASSTQLVCQVPVGASYEPISVLNTSTRLICQSLKPFATSFGDSSSFTSSSFVSAYDLTLSRDFLSPKYVIGKDLDGDGKTDVMGVSSAYGFDSLVVYRNTSSSVGTLSFSNFKSVLNVNSGGPGKFDLGDLDGDGLADVGVVTNGQYLMLARNTSSPGTIQFGNIMGLTCSGSSTDIKITDLDNDGKNDLVISTYGGAGGLVVIRSTSVPGIFSFADPVNIQVYKGSAGPLAVGDLDGDGKKDIVCYGGSSIPAFSCFHNTGVPGTIGFEQGPVISIPGSSLNVYSILLADIDGDGKLDVITTSETQFCSVYRNISSPGSISFASPINYPVGNGFGTGLTVADLNGDDKPDYLGTGLSGVMFTLMRNVSQPASIGFDNQVNYGGIAPYHANSGDFDGDGKTDIIVSNVPGGKGFTIYRNNMSAYIGSSVCEEGTDSLASDISGSSYQWEQDSGTGFEDVHDNAYFLGAVSQKLVLRNVTLSWNGFKYRCQVNGGSYSSIFRLQVGVVARPSVEMLAGDTVICQGTTVAFTARSKNVSSPYYIWRVNGQPQDRHDSIFLSDAFGNNDQVDVVVENGAGCTIGLRDTSKAVKLVVHAARHLSVSLESTDTTICQGAAGVFHAILSDTISNAVFQWQVNGISVGNGGDSFMSKSFVNEDRINVLLSSLLACTDSAISNSIAINVRPLQTPSVAVLASSNSVCSGMPVVFTAQAVDTGVTSVYQWLKNGHSVGEHARSYVDSALHDGDAISVELTTEPACAVTDTATSQAVVVAVTTIDQPVIGISGSVAADPGQALSLTSSVPQRQGVWIYQWQDSTSLHSWLDISGANADTVRYSPGKSSDRIRCVFTETVAFCDGQVFSDTSNVLSFVVSGITTPVGGDVGGSVHVFPNPVHGVLYLDSMQISDHWKSFEIISLSSGARLQIGSIEGQTAFSIPVNALPSSMYVLILRRKNGGLHYFKFLKL